MRERKWQKLIKKKLFRLIEQKGLEVTKLSIILGHDKTWLSRVKVGRVTLDLDRDLEPLLYHLGADTHVFMIEVAREKHRQHLKEQQLKNQIELVYD